jgi:hypothetical protein
VQAAPLDRAPGLVADDVRYHAGTDLVLVVRNGAMTTAIRANAAADRRLRQAVRETQAVVADV